MHSGILRSAGTSKAICPVTVLLPLAKRDVPLQDIGAHVMALPLLLGALTILPIHNLKSKSSCLSPLSQTLWGPHWSWVPSDKASQSGPTPKDMHQTLEQKCFSSF